MYPTLIKDLLGRRDYYSENKIIGFVIKSKNYDSGLEKLDQAAALLIFQTSKQQTWLVSTNKRLYCILDDTRKDEPQINWSIPKEDLDGKKISDEIYIRDYSEDIGLVDIGPKKNWLYSKKLFKKPDIKTSINQLLSKGG